MESRHFIFAALLLAVQPLAMQPGYASPAAADNSHNVPERVAQAEASVTIRAPADGAVIQSGAPVELDYAVIPGPRGDHVHVYMDGEEVAILRQLDGRHRLDPLAPGRHEVTIKVVNRAHVPIGVQGAVFIEAR